MKVEAESGGGGAAFRVVACVFFCAFSCSALERAIETAADADTAATVEAAARRGGKRAGEAQRAAVAHRKRQNYVDQIRGGKIYLLFCSGGVAISVKCVCVCV